LDNLLKADVVLADGRFVILRDEEVFSIERIKGFSPQLGRGRMAAVIKNAGGVARARFLEHDARRRTVANIDSADVNALAPEGFEHPRPERVTTQSANPTHRMAEPS
jgi:hypothetical protein